MAGHRVPTVASGGPPHGCMADSGWPTSYIVYWWWTTGGPSVANATLRLAVLCVAGDPQVALLPLIAAGEPLE